MEVSAPIADYGVLGDGQTAALVSSAGAIDWWCVPRIDSPSVFGRLLDPDAGHWTIQPSDSDGAATVTRRYVPGTLVLVTELRTASGVVELTDALALGRAEPHDIGRHSAPTLVRRLRGVAGEVDVAVELVPRFGYGRRPPRLRRDGGGVELADPASGTRLWLSSDRALAPDEDGVNGVRVRLRVGAGEDVGFVLAADMSTSPEPASEQLEETIATWRRWSDAHDRYDGIYAGEVRQSSLLLQALTYQPTGALVAAATTSLPEVWGGSANWDYRYAWLRDAAMVLRALWVGACPDEADRYFGWMSDAVGGSGSGSDERLQIVYDVDGKRDLTETELRDLRGYGESRPVRVGNDAWMQRQLDVPGEVIDAAWTLRERLTDPRSFELVGRLADVAAATWTETDAGIWEGREGERHYVSSKLMCWVALDRAVRLAARFDLDEDRPRRWADARERIRRRILAEGWSEQAGAFTGAFGSDNLDASVLLMPLVGFLPATDPRVTATVQAIEDQLAHDGLVRRWTGADAEGAFVMCSYWLAQCHALAGRVDRAAEIFEQVTGHANDLGVLAEMIDSRTGELLGNVPQALSHAAQICAAWTIDEATKSPDPETKDD